MGSVSPRSPSLTISSSHPFSANAAEEFFVRQSPLYEVVGQLGMWGTLINGVQAAALEHKGMKTANWNGAVGEFPPPIPPGLGTEKKKRFYVCEKVGCWWLTQRRCSYCTRRLRYYIGWRARCFITSACYLQTSSVSCSVSFLRIFLFLLTAL